MHKQLLYILFFGLCSVKTHAQDPQFSQVFAVPLYLGPSFAGASGGTRVASNFRDQWPAFKQEYTSYSLAVDYFSPSTNSGFGLAVFRDQTGVELFTSTYCLLQYSYFIPLTRKLQLRPGIEASYNIRSINYNHIVFGDQLSVDNSLPVSSIEPSPDQNFSYFDFATSVALFHPQYWFGISVHHLAKPNQSLLGSESKVPLKLSMYGGKRIDILSKRANRRGDRLFAAFEFKKQAKFSQLLTGSYLEYDDFTFGLWYRGIPFIKTYQSYINNDAVVLMVSYTFDKITVGYSYDITTSHLLANSAGSHEVSLYYSIVQKGKPKRKMIPCPIDGVLTN